MSDATFFGRVQAAPKIKAETAPLPKPQPLGAPVFMTDAITPLAGETVLSLLMKRMMRETEPPV